MQNSQNRRKTCIEAIMVLKYLYRLLVKHKTYTFRRISLWHKLWQAI